MPILALFDSEHVASFLTLTFLEIVLAGDNLVLIAILAGKLPEKQRPLARRFGLLAAVVTRLALLFSLFWIAQLETPIKIELPGISPLTVTPRQLVFALGGLFLIWKALSEISAMLVARDTAIDPGKVRPWRNAFALTILQIALFDVVFSLDSVMAAIGIARHLEVMVAAILAATTIMFFLVNPISNFIDRHQVVKLVALNFLVLIGSLLVADAAGVTVERAYFYVALGIAIAMQIVVLWLRSLAPWARLILAAAIVAFAGLIAASQLVDLEPVIGAQAAAILRNLVADGADVLRTAVEWLRRWLATI